MAVRKNRKKEDGFLVIYGERFSCMTIHVFTYHEICLQRAVFRNLSSIYDGAL